MKLRIDKNRLPEELVREKFLQFLVEKKGFPLSLISKEKALSELPHLAPEHISGNLPSRRVDLLCFFETLGELMPLLLIECKSQKQLLRCVPQIIGYNYFIKAPFCCLVNEQEILFSSGSDFRKIKDIPNYSVLVKKATGRI